jgi:hypothetical protein
LPTQQCLNENIDKIFSKFNTSSESGEIVDMKETCLSIFIETLTQASFDITFSSGKDVERDAGESLRVDGKLFLDELDIALRERSLQSFLPMRCMHYTPAIALYVTCYMIMPALHM